MESSEETGCQAPEGPILCVKNCGFFGSAATMNMCSKCHKDMILKQEQAQLAAVSIENLVNGGPAIADSKTVQPLPTELKVISTEPSRDSSSSSQIPEPPNPNSGPSRCNTCRKRVGLTGFTCRCGNVFCSNHRYSDKHDCPFDYRAAAQDAISKANPVVKADKIDKI